MVRIGNEIRQYKYDYFKAILDSDYGKINDLESFHASVDQVYVSMVRRQVNEIMNLGRTKTQLNYCDNVNGNYKLFGYEYLTTVNQGGTPCSVVRNDYYIKQWSQKKTLGIWRNHDTGEMQLMQATACLDFVSYAGNYRIGVYCELGGTPIRYAPFGYQWDYPLVSNYDSGPCASVDGAGYLVFRSGTVRYFYLAGKNYTWCDMQ